MLFGPKMVKFLIKNYYSDNKVIKKLLSKVLSNDLHFKNKILVDISKINSNVYISYFLENQINANPLIENISNYKLQKTNFVLDSHKRQLSKVGKFANSLGIDNLTNGDVEEFVNIVNSIFEVKIELYSSYEDIKKFYSLKSYVNLNGTLGSSCMKDDTEIKRRMLKIYSDNNIKLIVIKSENDNNKIISRALLWENVTVSYHNSKGINIENEKHTFLDRIYTNSTKDEEILKDFASKNGYIRKYSQVHNSKTGIVFPDGYVCDAEMSVNMDTKSKLYPYLDTFTYSNEFKNGDKVVFTNKSHKAVFSFTGYIDGIRKRLLSEFVTSHYETDSIRRIDSTWSELLQTYILTVNAIILHDENVCHKSEVVEVNSMNYYKYGNEVFKLKDDVYVLMSETCIVYSVINHNRIRVLKDNAVWDSDYESYVEINNTEVNVTSKKENNNKQIELLW